ncbi:MAG: 50S ribosomal protein L19e, partial [Methanobacteriota archaeon]
MTDLRNQVRMASEVMDCGVSRVYIDPLHTEEVAEAVTRADIRALVRKGYIVKLQSTGISRFRARKIAKQKAKGRRRGPGSRKGAFGARDPRKARWIRTIRPIREELKALRDAKVIEPKRYRHYLLQAKGGVF